jgi:hypothetical protein
MTIGRAAVVREERPQLQRGGGYTAVRPPYKVVHFWDDETWDLSGMIGA